MSLIKILPEYIETFSLTLHPEVNYVSSSERGSTGSMPLSPRPSKCFKTLYPYDSFGESAFEVGSTAIPGFDESDGYRTALALEGAVQKYRTDGAGVDISTTLDAYMGLVNSSSQIARNTKRFEIERFDPPFSYKINTSVKNCIRNVLMPYYMSHYDGSQFSYTNYNTLNFFTSSEVPSNSAIIYPNLQDTATGRRPLDLSGSFSIDFYINPRYSNTAGTDFRAGTIMHLSSTFAVSLVSGSQRGGDGEADSFRILLQLSHSADTAPHLVNPAILNNKGTYPNDLSFFTKDHALKKNHWHHVSIRWGGNLINEGSGSIFIDGVPTTFNVPSASIDPPKHVSAGALFVGNYYDGYDNEVKFFNETAASREGLYPIESGFTEDPAESKFKFNHPLNAEVHDLKIYNRYISNDNIVDNSKSGRSNTDDLVFYVPPFFSPDTKIHDEIITPFQTERKVTDKPFNTTFSFGVGGCLINLQNFVKEFKNNYHPRLYNLSASTIDDTVLDITANGYIYHTGSTRKRNLTILPNDNGLFSPDYDLLLSGTERQLISAFSSPLGGYDLSTIDLSEMVTTGSAYSGLTSVSANELLSAIDNKISELGDDTSMNNIANQIAGVTPEILSSLQGATSPGPILTIYQRTRDPSSNEISIFDISNLYYGNRIFPGSFHLTDPNITGSGQKVRVTLSDNGAGSLYRSDAATAHATWSNVGTVLYNEGIAVVKSPHIPFFGKDEFEAKFKGERNTHILTVNIPAETGLFNSSSNPSYKIISASLDASEIDPRFVYITGLYLHDDNLNVIMRSNFAQPVKKRTSDEIMIRFKQDF
jgi:hypothetical protein